MKFIYVFLFFVSGSVAAQDLLSEVDKNSPPENDFTTATFKGTRLVNFHTVETLKKGTLEFRIAHRFGALSSGSTYLYGLDGPATIQLRVDYAPTNRLVVGVGRTSTRKLVDGYIKYKFLQQTTDNSMPITFTGLSSINIDTEPNSLLTNDNYTTFGDRLVYMTSAMIARKFSSKFSLQVSPVFIHYNIVPDKTFKNDILSVAGSARFKFTNRIALTAEYIKRIGEYNEEGGTKYHDVLSLGFDVETGGHVFQVFVTNGIGINEVRAIPYTTSGFSKGAALGFNISRVFSLKK